MYDGTPPLRERPSQDEGRGDVSSGAALLKAPPLMHDRLIYNL